VGSPWPSRVTRSIQFEPREPRRTK
jgi:hypothetical protein